MSFLNIRSSSIISSGLPIIIAAALIAVIVPLGFEGSSIFTWTTVAIWALFAMATNILFGWTGLLSFGQAAFFGIGAYTVALLHEHTTAIPGVAMLLIAALLTALIAAIFATFALRTSGAEFAILTLVLAQVLWLLTYRLDSLRGEDGFHGLFTIEIISNPLSSDLELWYYAVAVVAVCVWLMWLLHRSTAGMSMRAVRDDPFRAAALGINVRRVQVSAFAASAGFAAIAGALMGQAQGVVSPGMLGFAISGEVLVACLIGGMGRFAGPILGAAVLVWTQTIISDIIHDSAMFVGIILILIVLLMPQGLVSLPGKIAAARRGGSSKRDKPDPSQQNPFDGAAPDSDDVIAGSKETQS